MSALEVLAGKGLSGSASYPAIPQREIRALEVDIKPALVRPRRPAYFVLPVG